MLSSTSPKSSSSSSPPSSSESTSGSEDDARGYLDAHAILAICKERGATLVHPGYGFLAENAAFAQAVADAGLTWLGPRAETIEAMGLKHEAREIARKAGVPVVPGSGGLVKNAEEAMDIARDVGWPVMLKATAGGGGMGLVVCRNEDELKDKIGSTMQRAKVSGRFVNRCRMKHNEYCGI